MGTVGELIPFTIGEEEAKREYRTAEEADVPGTVANIRYYHQTAPWDSPLSFGVQAFIEYNGLILNDRYKSDLIRVVSITGLDDAEIRDSREPRAGAHGEYPYEAFYGGRNLVLTGFVEAGSLANLNFLTKNLRAAFAPLEESPLKFRWFDIYDPFDDPNTILEYSPTASLARIPSGNYTAIAGSLSDLKVENSLLTWSTASKVYFLRVAEKRTFCDVQMTMKVFVGSEDESYIGFLPCVKTSEDYIVMKYKNKTGELIISAVNSGVETVLSPAGGIPLVYTTGQYFWLRGRKAGNELALEIWENEPTSETFPKYSTVVTLKGENEENFGDEILSQVGIAGEQKNTNWGFDEFKVESLYPGDVHFKARKLSPISVKDEQTSLTKFKRPFQITMRTSDFRGFCPTQSSNYIHPTSNTEPGVLRGRKYPRSYPLDYRSLIDTRLNADTNLLSVNNRGTVFVEPTFYLHGPGEGIAIQNLTNGQAMEWDGTIAAGDYIKINCKEETIENSLGINYLEPLIASSEWIKLEPMWNDIYVSGSGFEAGETKTKFYTKWHHGFI